MQITDRMMIDAYTGAGGFETGEYLLQHTRETDEDYARRQAVATYRNYVVKMISAYADTLFSQPAQRSGEAPAWATLQSNVDGTGGQIDDLMYAALALAMLVSPTYLIVDRPAGISLTRADDNNRLPYVVIRGPESVAELHLSRLGQIERVVFAEDGDAQGEVVYRGWDAQRWWVARDAKGENLLSDEAGQAMTGVHGLGAPPVVRLHSTRPLRKRDSRSTAWARGVVSAAVDLFNRHSEARQIEREQTVSTLALPVSDPSEAARLQQSGGVTLGVGTAVLYNPAGGGEPRFFAPSPAPLDQLYAAIEATVKEIYALANLEFVGGVQQSGVALAFHFQAANKTLSGLASMCEQAEIQLGRLACAWMGENSDDVRVVYPKSFNVEDLAARIQEDLDALSMDLGDTASKRIRQRAARRILGDSATPKDYETMDAEIEAGPSVDPYQKRAEDAADQGETP